MRVGIIGCGLIGNKRASVLGPHRLIMAADVEQSRAERLVQQYPGALAAGDWRSVIERPDIDAVVVATTHDMLAPITLQAVRAGKHVLVEKPAARNAQELEPVLEALHKHPVTVKAGFNHRFHPAMQRARKLLDSGILGPLMFLRGRYGHGGRPGYETEWRAVPEISGGGELLDQGMHLIDLSRWYLGDLTAQFGDIRTCYWDMPVEDNAFLYLKSPHGPSAWLHVSWTEWKNMFSLEIYGRDGKLQIDGLGRSYGRERLIHYRMLPQMGPPETDTCEFPDEDISWSAEFQDFCDAVEQHRTPCGSLADAYEALKIVGQIYGRKYQ